MVNHGRVRTDGGTETTNFETAQERVFDEFAIDRRSRFVELDHPQVEIHVTETTDRGDDVPVFFVHGGGLFGAIFAPVMAHLDGTSTISFDRPGYGLSEDFTYSAQSVRQTAVSVLDGILDELGIEQVDIVGNSVGGYWSTVFALDRPERVRRLILAGSVGGLPGTQPPLPMRLFAVPGLNRLLTRFQDASEDGVIEQFELYGERDSIQEHPSLIRAAVAQNLTPRSDDVLVNEVSSFNTIRGWRSSVRLRETELSEIQHSTLVIWGNDDPLGKPEKVRDTVERIPDLRFETLEAGHLPWLGYPEVCARLIREMR